MKIILIDDDFDVRAFTSKMLQSEGYEVFEAENGSEGLQIMRDHVDEVDLVITDIIMPDKEGIETIQELKRDYPDVRILAISGGGKVHPEGYLGLAKAMGANDTLSKPFIKQDLIDAVENAMS
ncbi:MAG: response regulator [Caldithrix sp.]|nr:response regulator [Caldithrix sp.]